MSEIIFFSASKKIFFCRNDVQAIDFLRKGSYAPGICIVKWLACILFVLQFRSTRQEKHNATFFRLQFKTSKENFLWRVWVDPIQTAYWNHMIFEFSIKSVARKIKPILAKYSLNLWLPSIDHLYFLLGQEKIGYEFWRFYWYPQYQY